MVNGSKPGPKPKYEKAVRKTVYIPESLDGQIKASGLNFSDKTTELWKAYLDSDELGIEELEEEIDKLETERKAKESQLKEKLRLKGQIDQLQLKEKIKDLIKPFILRDFLVKPERNGFRNWAILRHYSGFIGELFEFPKETIFEIRKDIETGVLAPDTPLEFYQKYAWTLKDKGMKEKARERLITELSQSTAQDRARKRADDTLEKEVSQNV